MNPNKITDILLLNQYETGNAKYKLLLTQSDRDALIKKIEGAPIPESLKSRVLDNYGFFAGQIAKLEISPSDLYDAIGKLQIVDIVLDRQYDDPQAIFESLNSTGKHSGIDHKTIALKDLRCTLIGRGTILKNDEVPNYERFLLSD